MSGRSRRGRHAKHVAADHRPPQDVRAVAGEDDGAPGRQLGHAPKLFVERHVDEPEHLESGRSPLNKATGQLRALAVECRCPGDDGYQTGAWQEVEGDVSRPLSVRSSGGPP